MYLYTITRTSLLFTCNKIEKFHVLALKKALCFRFVVVEELNMGEENHGKPFGFCGCFKARTGAIVTAILSMVGKISLK